MNSDDAAIVFTIKNVRWLKDEWGDYWVAELFQDGKRVGLTSSYYSLNEAGTMRLTREEQELNMPPQFGVA